MRILYAAIAGAALLAAGFAGGAYWQMKNPAGASVAGVYGHVVAVDHSFITIKLADGQQKTFTLDNGTSFAEAAPSVPKNVRDVIVGASVQVFAGGKTNSVTLVQILPATSLTRAAL